MKPEFNMAWGEPYIVRQALLETLDIDLSLANIYLDRMEYPPHLGTPKLIDRLKTMAERQSGHRPKHLFVTCGATGALNAALYALRSPKSDWVVTDKRYYPIYPSIIEATNHFEMINEDKQIELLRMGLQEENFLSLTASPSAPEGFVNPFCSTDIWDAAYASKTYSVGSHTPNGWKVMCGSLAKTLGLPGLRLGWISTDDDLIAHKLDKYITSSYIGLSSLSMSVAEEVLDNLNQDKFETRSARYLDSNREEVQKLLTKFGQGEVPGRGMFAILELGKAERKALERANIKWQPGNSWGEDENWARLSLGQTREVVRSAVKAALK